MNANAGRILVVDDDRELCESFGLVLDRYGYQTASALDGRTALELLEDNLYDVVLLDLRMPEMDGLETLLMIRDQAHEASVVLMTGHTQAHQVARAIKLGVDGVIYKPFRIESIVQNLMQDDPLKLHEGYLQTVWNRITPVIGVTTARAVFQKAIDKFREEQGAPLFKAAITLDGFALTSLLPEEDSTSPGSKDALRRSLRQLLAEVYSLLNMLTGNMFEEAIIEDLSNHLKSVETSELK